MIFYRSTQGVVHMNAAERRGAVAEARRTVAQISDSMLASHLERSNGTRSYDAIDRHALCHEAATRLRGTA